VSLRINLFTLGDCTDINTWSNLPYYFFRHLVEQGISVQTIDLIPSNTAGYAAVRQLTALRDRAVQIIRSYQPYELFRTRGFRALANRQLRSTAQQHRDADLNVFLTFSFSSYGYTDVPVIHYCDRTYELYLEETGRKPTRKDISLMRIDQQNIENADLVLTTNQLCCDFIKTRYKPKRAFCLRAGVSSDVDIEDPQSLIASKEDSTDILFIGRGSHKRGADILVRAFRLFNAQQGNQFTLHIVGVQKNELPEELQIEDSKMQFHGYLDRSIPAHLERYNALMRSAKIFVMPMRPGPFPGVIREAQMHCTPVIASNALGANEYLKHDYDSVLLGTLEPPAIAAEMGGLIRDRGRWRQLAWNAHQSRRNSTWKRTVQDFLNTLRENDLVLKERLAQ